MKLIIFKNEQGIEVQTVEVEDAEAWLQDVADRIPVGWTHSIEEMEVVVDPVES
jgi:hypothetical protein